MIGLEDSVERREREGAVEEAILSSEGGLLCASEPSTQRKMFRGIFQHLFEPHLPTFRVTYISKLEALDDAITHRHVLPRGVNNQVRWPGPRSTHMKCP